MNRIRAGALPLSLLFAPLLTARICVRIPSLKVERTTGDDSRTIGPFSPDGESSYFMSVNRGKRSVAIDTKSQPGKDILKLLARDADVLVENFRPGVMDRLGVGYDVLKEVNPRLIYCSVSGFGPTGVHAKRPAFDSLLQAAGGLISATGPADPAQSPVRVGCSIVDMCSGLHSTIGVLAAIHERSATGVGQRVDTNMLATTAMLMESPISRHSFGGEEYLPRPEGLAHPAVAPFDGFRTKDGTIYIATSNDARAHVALESPRPRRACTQPEYATNPARMAHRERSRPLMEARLAAKTTAEWERELIPAGVPCSAINDIAQLKRAPPRGLCHHRPPHRRPARAGGRAFEFSESEVDYARARAAAGRAHGVDPARARLRARRGGSVARGRGHHRPSTAMRRELCACVCCAPRV